MATAAKLNFTKAVEKTYRAGAERRKALLQFASEDGIDVNQDRELARNVVQGWEAVLTTIKQTWGL